MGCQTCLEYVAPVLIFDGYTVPARLLGSNFMFSYPYETLSTEKKRFVHIVFEVRVVFTMHRSKSHLI